MINTLMLFALSSTTLAQPGGMYTSESGELSTVVENLSQKYDFQVFFRSRLLKDKNTDALSANTLPALMNALLANTDLEAQWISNHSLVIGPKAKTSAVKPSPKIHVDVDDDAPEVPEKPLIEYIEVRGIRSSLQEALLRKRHAVHAIDVITAEDIGKLPDTTIADSLQRVTGIQIGRSAGEGSKLNVRGMPQVTTLLNGEQMVTGSSINVLQPNYIDVPSALVSSIEVIKAPQPGQFHTGISGTIDIQTWQPSRLKEGVTVYGTMEKSTGSDSQDNDHRVNLLLGYNDNNLGFVINGYQSKSRLTAHFLGAPGNNWWQAASEHAAFYDKTTGGSDYSGDGDTNDSLLAHQAHAASNRLLARERTGLNSTIQFNFTPHITIKGDVFYTRMTQHDRIAMFSATQSWNDIWGWYLPDESWSVPDTFSDEGEVFYMTKGTLQATSLLSQSRTEVTENHSLNTNLELEYINQRLTNTFRFVYGSADSQFENSTVSAWFGDGSAENTVYSTPQSDSLINPGGYPAQPPINANGEIIDSQYGVYPVGIDYRGQHPAWDLSMFSDEMFGAEKSRYGFIATNSGRNFDDNVKLHVVRNDTKFEFYGKHLSAMRAGLRYSKRQNTRDFYDYLAPFTSTAGNTMFARWKDARLLFPDTGYAFTEQRTFADLPAQWLTQISDFGPATGIPALWFVDPKTMDNPKHFQEMLFPGHIRASYPNESYKVGDKTFSAYMQAEFSGDSLLAGVPYVANVGVRVLNNEIEVLQFIEGSSQAPLTINGVDYIRGPGAPADVIGSTVTRNRHKAILPGINISLMPSDDHVFRFSWSKRQTEHDAENLGRGLTVSRKQDVDDPTLYRVTSARRRGNPNLKPWQSNNVDVSWEWYFNSSALLSLGAFYIDVDTFIENSRFFVSDIADSDGIIRKQNLPVDTIDNGEDGSLKGIEVNWQSDLSLISEYLPPLGLQINYTWASSESAKQDYYGKPLPVPDNSEHQANAVVWYETRKLRFRLAWNYRSKRFISQLSAWDAGSKVQRNFAQWQSPTQYWDFSVNYRISPNIELYATVNNLSEEYNNTYIQWENLTYQQEINEARYAIGVNLTLF